jgi:hypothetical protein
MGRAEREEYDYRPTVDYKVNNVDLLLVGLRKHHGEPRYDIPPDLLKNHKGYAGKYHRKPLERP